jgi:cytoskeletal protein RodZ
MGPDGHGDTGGFGETLRHAREARGLTVTEVSEITKIRARYLEALEREEWRVLPPAVYALGFVKLYARTLGLDPESLADAFQRAVTPASQPLAGRSAPLSQAPITQGAPQAPVERSRRRRVSRPARSPASPTAWAVGVVVLAVAVVAMLLLIHRQAPSAVAVPRTPTQSSTHHPQSTGRHPTSHHAHQSKAAPQHRTHPNTNAGPGNHRRGTAPVLVSASTYFVHYQAATAPITVTLTFSGRCWIEEWINGVSQGTGGAIFNAGQTKTFRASQSLELWVGAPSFASFAINGHAEGLMSAGSNGQARHLLVTVKSS